MDKLLSDLKLLESYEGVLTRERKVAIRNKITMIREIRADLLSEDFERDNKELRVQLNELRIEMYKHRNSEVLVNKVWYKYPSVPFHLRKGLRETHGSPLRNHKIPYYIYLRLELLAWKIEQVLKKEEYSHFRGEKPRYMSRKERKDFKREVIITQLGNKEDLELEEISETDRIENFEFHHFVGHKDPEDVFEDELGIPFRDVQNPKVWIKNFKYYLKFEVPNILKHILPEEQMEVLEISKKYLNMNKNKPLGIIFKGKTDILYDEKGKTISKKVKPLKSFSNGEKWLEHKKEVQEWNKNAFKLRKEGYKKKIEKEIEKVNLEYLSKRNRKRITNNYQGYIQNLLKKHPEMGAKEDTDVFDPNLGAILIE